MKLELEDINKSFGENHVLKNISLTVESGRAFGLLGRNGSGKTTTIRVITKFFKSDSGKVLLDGKNFLRDELKIGYLPEERGLYPKRLISEQMSYFGQLRGLTSKQAKENAVKLLERLGASEYYNKKLETLSKGNQQKIQLAVSVINDPDIVILDEPFSGLDPVNSQILKTLVTDMVKEGKMVIFSSHEMSYVEEFCDDIALINKGEIVLAGDLKKIKKSYPRTEIFVVPENENIELLLNFEKSNDKCKAIVNSVTKFRNGVKFSLKEANYKNDLFHLIIDSEINFDTFTVIEPTLEEIFIEKAGDVKDE